MIQQQFGNKVITNRTKLMLAASKPVSNATNKLSMLSNDTISSLANGCGFVKKWGSHGNSDGQFYGLVGITVDSSGNVYVVDGFNNRIQKFDNSGKFITKWGSLGSGDGQFNHPNGLAVDTKTGKVYVVDFEKNNRIQVFARKASRD